MVTPETGWQMVIKEQNEECTNPNKRRKAPVEPHSGLTEPVHPEPKPLVRNQQKRYKPIGGRVEGAVANNIREASRQISYI